MPEKKNIVIKVKYPSEEKTLSKPVSSTSVITEWNYKRIGIVVGGLLCVLLVFLNLTDNKETPPESPVDQAVPEPVANIKTQPEKVNSAPEKNNIQIDKILIRSELTNGIEKNEPIDKVNLPLKIGKDEKTWIYYFAEIRNMKGKSVYHEWLLNGELVVRKKVNISSDPWRTASKQVITYTMNNDWLVRLVDESGNKLDEKTFNLELK